MREQNSCLQWPLGLNHCWQQQSGRCGLRQQLLKWQPLDWEKKTTPTHIESPLSSVPQRYKAKYRPPPLPTIVTGLAPSLLPRSKLRAFTALKRSLQKMLGEMQPVPPAGQIEHHRSSSAWSWSSKKMHLKWWKNSLSGEWRWSPR